MLKTLSLAAVMVLLSFGMAHAQDDSLNYDLGRVLVKKSGTQTKSISGKDLERYQASDLSDAINVWLYGTYTKNTSITYVIDGNIISDVNAYSIYDIEEVTLVQTAVAQSGGASPDQQMVLIKTRTNRPGKKGIEVNGQTSLVNLRNQANTPGVTSQTSTYDQYYLSAYRNYQNTGMGVSAEYQRDVGPGLNGNGLEFLEPAHYNRLKLNAWFNANLGKHNVLTFGVNYVPQVTDQSHTQDTTVTGSLPDHIFFKSHVAQHMANLNLSLKSDIVKGLTNRFSVAYNHYNNFEADSVRQRYDTLSYVSAARASESSHNLLVRDYLYYHAHLGGWDFESTLNMTYRNFEDSLLYDDIEGEFTDNTPYFSVHHPSSSRTSYKNLMLSPSFDLYYGEVFNMQGGFVGALDKGKAAGYTGSTGSSVFPFLNLALSPLKLIGITAIKWQLYGSYARQSPLITEGYSTLAAYDLLADPAFTFYNNPGYNQFQQYNNYQAGMAAGLTKNFSISYSQEYKYASSLYEVRFFSVANDGLVFGLSPYNSKTTTSHFTLYYNLYTSTFTWNASLNGTESEVQVIDNPALAATYNTTYLGAGHRWSGGYTNRFTYKLFFAGIDFLYQAGARPDNLISALQGAPDYVAPSNNNSFTVQNCYFGSRIKVPHMNYLELYVNSRNLVQNSSSNITDNRRFYGAGVKAGF